ncbi:serine-rich coiled-coil domain-containing protein 2 isoform X2 [Oryzias latipes]|nr:serine-rich coiled-coil domain-containing protein 2 isoform X2 [Oryzias latipes]
MRKSGSLMVAVSSPKAVPKQTLKISPKSRADAIQSSLGVISKVGSNGSSISARTGSESRLARPMLGSCSPRSISQDSLPQSIDDLKKQTLDSIVRSNSFTHFKQIPSPTGEPMTRSFSFNRTVELAKPLANTQLRPPRSSLLKVPQLSNGRVILGINGNHGSPGFLGGGTGGLQYSRNPQVTNSQPNPSTSQLQSTPRALKKPLLPCSVLTKSLASTGSVGCRIGQTKQQKPLLPDKVREAIGTSSFSESEGLLKIAVDNNVTGVGNACSSNSESDGSPENDVRNDEKSAFSRQSFCQAAAETLEDMSLSSASSLDRCDTSEELIDDLDYVGDELNDGEMSNNRKCGSITQIPLSEAVELDLTNLPETEEESPMQDSQGPLVVSSEQGEAQQASSVEISPSNSSGGTYMWDEEGLQPLGIHETQSLDYDDSEINSMDILNNLDPLRTGDLDDDDLMLDVDLPEDGFHDFDSMSQFERFERGSRHGQRRNQHHWNGPELNDNRAHVLRHFDGLKASRTSSRPLQSKGMQHECRSALDELTLEHMSQDCNLLKNQLLRLKMLLQLEETDLPGEISEETEENTSAAQLDTLMKEVQELREELRSRDKTIAQLTAKCQQLQQLQQEQTSFPGQTRCQCHHQGAPSSLRPHGGRQGEKRHLYDKATQTHWRPPNHAPQILQPFKPCLIEPSHRERPVRTLPIEGHNELSERTSEEATRADDCPPEALVADVCWAADPDKLTHRLRTNLPCLRSCTPQEMTAKDSPASAQQCAAQHGCKSLAVITHDPVAPRSAGSTCPRTLPPPRLHKRMPHPSPKLGGAGGSPRAACFAGSSANQAKQLPPPSRGLPCFNAGPWVQTQKLFSTSITQPLRTSEPGKDSWHTNTKSLEESTQARLGDTGSAKTLIPLRRSCLPKPKIP